MSIGERAEAFLPGKAPSDPAIFVYVVSRTGFDVTDEIGESNVWFQAEQDVRVVWHAVDGDQFLALAGDDAGDVFVQFFFAFRRD